LLTFRDGPPFAILEAMAVGLPILCLDVGAVSELVPASAGTKIKPLSRRQVIEEAAITLQTMAAERSSLHATGSAGRSHALARHDWARLRLTLRDIYEQVEGQGK
jgi:glycosyltransferase involved in cell wall biosynthesis